MRLLLGINIVLTTAIFVDAYTQYTVEKMKNKCIKVTSKGSKCLNSLNGNVICMVELTGSRKVLQKCENKPIRTITIICCPEGVYYQPTVSTVEQRTTEVTATTKHMTKTTSMSIIKHSEKDFTKKAKTTTIYQTLNKKSTASRPTIGSATPLTTTVLNKTSTEATISNKQELNPETTVATQSCNLQQALKEFRSKMPLKQNKCKDFKSYKQELDGLWSMHDANLDIIKNQMRDEKKRIDALIAKNKIYKVDLKKMNRSLEIWKASLKAFEEEHYHGLVRISSKYHNCIFIKLMIQKRDIMMKFIDWVQSSSDPDMTIVYMIAKDLQSFEDDYKQQQARIFKHFEFLSPKLRRVALRQLENHHIALESVQLAKCVDSQQHTGFSGPKGVALADVLSKLNATKESDKHQHEDIQNELENFLSSEKLKWIKASIETDEAMTSSVASGEDSNSHSNGSGGGEYSGDNSDTESSGDNKEGSGDVMVENNDDEDAMRHVSKPTQTTSRPRNTRPPDIKKSQKSKMTTTEKYRPRLLPTTDVPSQENRLELAIKRLLNEYPSEKNGCDEKTIDRSEEESRMAFSSETALVVQRWDEAQKKYSKMKLNDYRKAERFLLKALGAVTKSMNNLKRSEQTSDEENRRNRAECINRQILKDQRDALVDYTIEIQKPKLSLTKIVKQLKRFIDVCHHLHVYKLQHGKRGEEYTVRYKMKQHIKDLNVNIKKMLKLLEYLPKTEVVAKIKREVWLKQINFTFKTIQSL
ncbi:uncharacterized protein [Clytia hemisphaerica]|uniref:E2 domain-containing protein n=1 Tax=Clytia hemisphaerica TaxID=252671 RepID=A0A7M5UK05_9CNID